MTAPADILIYVQHLLGIGHLRRAALIAKGLAAAGQRVLMVSGGLPLADLDLGAARLAQLPPLRAADADFSGLVDAQGQAIDETWQARRRDQLLALFQAARPRLLLIEMFPFGRRQLRFELLPLLEAAWQRVPRPAIACSLRDVLNPPASEEKAAWMVATAQRWFDRVLVHSDPALIRLEDSFAPAASLADLITYTGYIAALPPDDGAANRPEDPNASAEVLVSAGGGAVGAPILAAALAARGLTREPTRPWRILAGPNLPESSFQRSCAAAPAGVTVERFRSDFQCLLRRCACSVSQAGYNTVMEVLASRRPAIVIPFATADEREQQIRAEVLAHKGWLRVVPEAELTGRNLARAVDAACSGTEAVEDAQALPKFDGVRETVRQVTALMGAQAT